MRTLTHDEARSVYDRIGPWQDSQAFYEDVATREIVRVADFPSAQAVFEFGCGTGRFAEMLLRDQLGPDTVYRAVDVSPRMISLARERLAPFEDRARVVLTDGSTKLEQPDASVDRFCSNYVLDLLSTEDITNLIAEARRILRPGGLLCLTSLSRGGGTVSRGLIAVWTGIHRLNPKLVGGCRAIELQPFLEGGGWKLLGHQTVTPLGVPSEWIVAERLPDSGGV
jgi:ubiquinone/menaquinone biosynthesis C-methylase UbiE